MFLMMSQICNRPDFWDDLTSSDKRRLSFLFCSESPHPTPPREAPAHQATSESGASHSCHPPPLRSGVRPRIRQRNTVRLGVEGRPQSCRFGTRSAPGCADSSANPDRAVAVSSRRTQNSSLTKPRSIWPPVWREIQPTWGQLFPQSDEKRALCGWGTTGTLD